MMPVALALFGWLVPGGAYLLTRRYRQFTGFALLVSITFAAGLALHGAFQLPRPEDLRGLDGLTALLFQAGSWAKLLAGGPYLLAHFLSASPSFLEGRLHEYGTTLLLLAGVFNLLAIAGAVESRSPKSI